GGNAWEWDPVTEAFAATHHVIALDQRGHGASDWASDYRPARMTDDVAAVIAAPHLERPAIIAHSMGGILVCPFAAGRPGELDRLVICDVGPDSIDRDFAVAFTEGLRAAALATYAAPEDALAEWLASTAHPNEPLLRHYVDHNI